MDNLKKQVEDSFMELIHLAEILDAIVIEKIK